MINHNKITAAKVAQRLSGSTYMEVRMPTYTNDKDYRIYLTKNTDIAGKLYLSCHHLKNCLVKIDRYLENANATPPIVVNGGNNMQDFKFMCKYFREDIETRMIPSLIGLREFSTPHNETALAYKKIMSKYDEKIAAIELIFPEGKGRYTNSYRALIPHFKELLLDLSAFTKRAIADYS